MDINQSGSTAQQQTNFRLPPIKQLFQQAWDVTTGNVFHLFMLGVVSILITGAYTLIIGVLGVWLTMASGILAVVGSGSVKGLSAVSPMIFVAYIVLFVLLFVGWMVIASMVNSALILLMADYPERKMGVGGALKKGLTFVIPLFFAGCIAFFLTTGAFFVFIFPAFVIAFLLMYVQYEIVLNDKGPLAAVTSSVRAVSSHFGEILVRMFLYYLLYIAVVAFIPNLLRRIDPTTGIMIGFLSVIANVFIGWFGFAYGIVLFRQTNEHTDYSKKPNVLWIWIVAVVGWVIVAVSAFAMYNVGKVYFNKTFAEKIALDLAGKTAVNKEIESTKTVSPQVAAYLKDSQTLFAQLKSLNTQVNNTNEKAVVAQMSKLNDQNILALKKATELDPQNAQAWYDLGNAQTWVSSQGSLEEGLEAYKKAEALEPTSVNYSVAVGDMLIRLKRYDEAVLQLQKALRINERSAYAHTEIADAYRLLKVRDAAKTHYTRAIELYTVVNKDGSFDQELLAAQKGLAAVSQQ